MSHIARGKSYPNERFELDSECFILCVGGCGMFERCCTQYLSFLVNVMNLLLLMLV